MRETLVFSGVNTNATKCKYRGGAEFLIDSSVQRGGSVFLFELTLYIFTIEKVTLGHSKLKSPFLNFCL